MMHRKSVRSRESKNAVSEHDRIVHRPAIQAALTLLADGYDCARERNAKPAEYAIPAVQLREAGCNDTLLHWLVACRNVRPVDRKPAKAKPGTATAEFSADTRFVITTSGIAVALRLAGEAAEPPRIARPRWDALTGDLWLRGRLVHHFKNAASNQREILDAFQAEGWPTAIANPLKQERPTRDGRKQRLHDAIKNLNRGLAGSCLRFYGTGGGQRVGWRANA